MLGPDGNRLASKTLDVSISGPAGVPTTTKGTLSTIDPRSLWLLLLGLSLAGALVLYGSSARRRRRGGRTPGRLVLVRGVTPALLALLLPTYGCGPQMMPATARSEALTEGSVLDPAGTVYYHGNHLGSASVVSDAAGNEILRVTYAPFGEIDPVNSGKKTATGTLDKNVPMAPIGFTGQSFGRESGLYHLQARVYDPGLGIMTTPDTMVPDPLSGKDLNAYAYARGNPVRYYDPTGHIVWLVPVLIGFAVGAMIGGTKGEILRNPFEAETWNNFSWKGALAGGAIGAAVGYGWWALGAYVPGSTFGVANGAILQSGLTGGITNTVLTYAGGENDPWQLAAAFGAGAINGMFAKTGMWFNPLYSFAVKPIVTALDPNRPLQFGAFGFEWEHGSGWDFSFRFNWGYWVTMALELTITTNWPLSNIREGQLASLEEKAGFWVLSFTFDETVMRKWEDWVFAEGSDGGAAQKGAFFLGVLFFGGMRVGLGALMLNNIVCADDPDSCGIPPNEW